MKKLRFLEWFGLTMVLISFLLVIASPIGHVHIDFQSDVFKILIGMGFAITIVSFFVKVKLKSKGNC